MFIKEHGPGGVGGKKKKEGEGGHFTLTSGLIEVGFLLRWFVFSDLLACLFVFFFLEEEEEKKKHGLTEYKTGGEFRKRTGLSITPTGNSTLRQEFYPQPTNQPTSPYRRRERERDRYDS